MTSTELTASDKTTTKYLDQLTAEQRTELDALVHQVNAVQNTVLIQTAYTMGQLVLDKIFDGDVHHFRRKEEGSLTWRALGEHPSLKVSHSTLWYAVALHENLALLGKDVCDALSLRHHRLLAHVADVESRRQFARRAVAEELTTRALEAEIKTNRKTSISQKKRGRKPVPEYIKRLARASKELGTLKVEDGLEEATRSLALATAQKLATTVASLIERLGDRTP